MQIITDKRNAKTGWGKWNPSKIFQRCKINEWNLYQRFKKEIRKGAENLTTKKTEVNGSNENHFPTK